jgi:prepilin-type N-terminal cleavage/methylation domain-containing protein
MSAGRRDGFTLIELAVVIALVAFLAGGLAAVCAGMNRASRLESTRSLVRALDAACDSYRARLGQYPGFPRTANDTTVLHRALCVPAPFIRGDAGADGARLSAPFLELPSSRLSCAPQIHDDWGWPVRYSLPGPRHPAADTSRRFDIDASSAEAGELGNWNAGR